MCTVTFIPERDGKAFLLTSNRDESPNRPSAERPKRYEHYGQGIFYPRDPLAGGTWIAAADSGYTLCLLNGAFKKHEWSPPYRKSRGLVLLDFFRFNDPLKFADEYDFNGIEPFTLLMLNKDSEIKIYELRWDEKATHLNELDANIPFIRSSATLYSNEVINNKEKLFSNWIINNLEPSAEEVFDFHISAGSGDPKNDFVMNRDNKVKTVSITQVNRSETDIEMVYKDILNTQIHNLKVA